MLAEANKDAKSIDQAAIPSNLDIWNISNTAWLMFGKLSGHGAIRVIRCMQNVKCKM